MANMAMSSAELGAEGAIIANITLFAVLIYELIGPMLTKIALLKAGDIDPEGKTSARHEHAQKMVAKAMEQVEQAQQEQTNG
jgi:hypothetical protein